MNGSLMALHNAQACRAGAVGWGRERQRGDDDVTRSTRSGHCWASAGRFLPQHMTGCTPVHGKIQNAAAKKSGEHPGGPENR